MTHTPGPWKTIIEAEGFAGSTTGKDFGIIDSDYNIIAEAFHQLDDDLFADAEANARLIAAAPDMLAALKLAPPLPMRSNMDFWFDLYKKWWDDTRAEAIAKAEGKE